MDTKKEIERVKNLYGLYGFTEIEEEDFYLVFTFSSGYFNNAEIICFAPDTSYADAKKKEYESIGYLVKVTLYDSYEKVRLSLFEGFFEVAGINSRLQKEYDRFQQLQSQKLYGAQYEYVEPGYYRNDEIRNIGLVDGILEQLEAPGAQLIILEAAAGYGKTCTSYALLKKMADCQALDYVPIFTELSKNRRATVFRYVLLDEIDRKFSSLSSKLVISEIQEGTVPLVIDGFDELISRSNPSVTNSNLYEEDESQTMLETIADLFQGDCKTKVILTSRKSAIFTGDVFQEWVEKKLTNCNVTRISIEEPTVRDWLGYEKTEYLEKQSIPFASIVNPILLAFMRSLPLEKFMEQCRDVEKVITYYFDSLLSREKERQALLLSVQEQYGIMKALARYFVELEIVADELAFIKDILSEIIHEKYCEYRDRYISTEEKPSEEEFANKLAGHALLNRVSPTKNQIGFINDFVFGIFIGELIVEGELEANEIKDQFVDIACTAYASRSMERRLKLLQKIKPVIKRFNYEQQLDIELKLASTIQQDYYQHYFSNRTFNKEVYLDGEWKFIKCTFRNCTFHECIFMTSSFSECSFYDCRFYNVQIMRDTVRNCKLIFSSNCVGHETFATEASYEIPIPPAENYEKELLKKFWPDNSRLARRSLPEKVLLATSDMEIRREYEKTLEELGRKGLLRREGHSWVTVTEKIGEIREILEK